MIEYMKKFELKGKVAIVVGGLGLIGKEITKALAQAQARVIVLDNNQQAGIEFENKLKEEGLLVNFIEHDMTKLDSFKSLIKNLSEKFGEISVCVNTSYPRTKDWGTKLEDVSVESWNQNVEMHLGSYCLFARDFAEYMKNNKIKGSIVMIGSTYGVVGANYTLYEGTTMTMPALYSAIKGGIVNFVRCTASFYGQFGIRINVLNPGGIFDNQNSQFVERYNKLTPLKRMGNPDDIASAALFLASEASSYITGSSFMVDGGWTCI